MVSAVDLIERDDQIATLDGLAAATCAGKGQLALICGAPTTGCTSLLEAFTDRAASRYDMVTLAASCSRPEQDLRCGVLGQLLDAPQLPSPWDTRIKELVAAIVQHTADYIPGSQPDPELLRLFHQLCLRLRELAAERPLLIAVDDIVFADPVSVDFLRQLAPRLRSARIMVVLTRSIRNCSNGSALPSGFHLFPYTHLIFLTPLSQAGIHTLLARQCGAAEADRLAAEFHSVTGGNPVLLRALIEGARRGEEHDSYGLAFLDCLDRCEPLSREIVRPLAVLGEDADQVPLSVLVDAEPTAVDWALHSLSAAGLVDGTFRHPAAGPAILGQMSAADRAALHQRAADALAKAGAPAPAVARHLREAGSPPPPWGVEILRDAADHMIADHQPRAAAEFLEFAMREATDAEQEAALRARLAQIESTLDPAAAATHLDPMTAAFKAGHVAPRDGATLVRLLLWHGRAQEASEVLRNLRDGADAHAEAAVETQDLELWLAYTHPALARIRKVSASVSGASDVRALRPLADRCLHATAALVRLLALGRYGAAEERALQVLRDLGVAPRTGWADEWLLTALPMLIRADRADAVVECCKQLADHPDANSSPTWHAILAAAQAEAALGSGDLETAAEHAERALSILPPTAWGVAVGLPRSVLIAANTRMGRLDKAGTELAYPVPEAMFQSRYGLYYLHERGHYYLATKHHHAALADFLSCGELTRTWGLDAARVVPWRTSAAEACLRLGDKDRARRLASENLAQSGHDGPRNRARALRVLAVASPAAQRPSMMMEALELFENCGDQFEQARTLVGLSETYQALNDNRRARMVFRRGLYLARLCGADSLYWELLSIGETLGETTPVNQPDDRLAVLTESEQRVAALAALGYTNREIAGKLYITPSTVEQHLTKAYRKLKITHRRELPADLATRGRPPARAKSARSRFGGNANGTRWLTGESGAGGFRRSGHDGSAQASGAAATLAGPGTSPPRV
jgi:DNA-binding CsgD family transcriptional regulator